MVKRLKSTIAGVALVAPETGPSCECGADAGPLATRPGQNDQVPAK